MVQDHYSNAVELVKDECARQIESAGLPSGLKADLEKRQILFGEHPESLVVLPLVMYRALGGAQAEKTSPACAAMEFLLAAADVLDDVQDMAIPTATEPKEELHTHYIKEIELVTALLLLGEQAMVSLFGRQIASDRITHALAIFNTFKMRSFSGQYQDAHGKVGFGSDLEASASITSGKSGSLGRCAAEMGAALYTSDSELIDRCGKYGEHLAIARQFHDDVANLWPSTGKLEDLEQLKFTLPLTFALNESKNGGQHNESTLGALVNLDDLDGTPRPQWTESPLNGQVKKAQEEIFSGGAIHFALLQSVIHLVRARTIGRQIETLAPEQRMLEELAST